MARALGSQSSVEAGKENPEVKGGTQIYLLLTYGKVVSPFTIQNQTGGKRIYCGLRRLDAHDEQEGFDCNDFQVSDDSHNSQWRSADA